MHSELITRIKLFNVSIVSYDYLCLYMHKLLCIVRSVNIFSLYKPQVYNTVVLVLYSMMYNYSQ